MRVMAQEESTGDQHVMILIPEDGEEINKTSVTTEVYSNGHVSNRAGDVIYIGPCLRVVARKNR